MRSARAVRLTKTRARLVDFLIRWEMIIHGVTIALFGVIAVALVVFAPGLSNLRLGQLLSLGSFLTALTAMIGALKARR